MGGITILSTLVLIGGGAYAFFSNTGTSAGNVFAAGTLDLKLTDDNEPAADDVSLTWNGADMVPGGASVSATLYLKNSGSVPGDHAHIKAAHNPTDVAATQDQGTMASHFKILSLTYDGGDILPLLGDDNANGYKDLEDLEDGGDGLKVGSLTDLNVNHPLVMSVQLADDVDNTYQGDSVSTVFTVTLHQNSSQ